MRGSRAESLADAGCEAAFQRHDVTSEDDWRVVVAATLARFGRIDVLVNSAGVAGSAPLLESSLEAWRAVLAVNLDGVFLGLRHVAPAMIESGGGSVINLASILGKVGQPGAAAYCASKGGDAAVQGGGAGTGLGGDPSQLGLSRLYRDTDGCQRAAPDGER